MSGIAWEILLVLLLIIVNGIFSGSEIAVVSARKVRLEQMVSQGNKKARIALKLAKFPNDFLSTVQIGITLIGILSGAIGGATIAQRLQPFFDNIPFLKAYGEGISVGIVVTLITYLSLVIGELMPKRIALNNPEKTACIVAEPMEMLSWTTAPLVHLLSSSTDWLLNLFNIQANQEPPITEEEIKVLIEQATQSGMFEESEQEMVERIFRLGDRPIKALMTPRVDIIWVNVKTNPDEIQQQIIDSPYSRFPVGINSLDNCIGILHGSDFLSARLAGREINLPEMVQPPLYVPENTPALKVLEQVKLSGIPMALITDEYGGLEGLVTLNDLMEAIVGEIISVDDHHQPMVVQREDGSWLLDGLLSIDELKDLLEKENLPKEETRYYHTLGGFIVTYLGHIPQAGDYFEWEGLRFEVMDMDGTRVDKVLVMAIPIQATSSPENDDAGQ
jgi:putative hemolysin